MTTEVRLLSAGDVAHLSGVSLRRVQRLTARGIMPAHLKGGKWWYTSWDAVAVHNGERHREAGAKEEWVDDVVRYLVRLTPGEIRQYVAEGRVYVIVGIPGLGLGTMVALMPGVPEEARRAMEPTSIVHSSRYIFDRYERGDLMPKGKPGPKRGVRRKVVA